LDQYQLRFVRFDNPTDSPVDHGYNRGYTSRMKTAISIPDPVFQAAEEAAGRLAMSRSELYTRAVEAYLAVHCPEQVTEKLDEVYAEEESGLEPAVAELQGRSLDEESW
jgi:metal-responsive CopG/Arc/MetJ family transcriptional regulator